MVIACVLSCSIIFGVSGWTEYLPRAIYINAMNAD